jgi:hypothetical protein
MPIRQSSNAEQKAACSLAESLPILFSYQNICEHPQSQTLLSSLCWQQNSILAEKKWRVQSQIPYCTVDRGIPLNYERASMVTHTSQLGGRQRQEDCGLRLVPGKSARPYLKNKLNKKK